MCLIALAYDPLASNQLIVTANRDEFHARPTKGANFWADQPSILAGRDLQGGGTWMGVDRSGRFAALTNYTEPDPRSTPPNHAGRLDHPISGWRAIGEGVYDIACPHRR